MSDAADFGKLLDGYPAHVAAIANAARALVFDVAPNALEEVDYKARVIGYGTGPGYSGLVCTIIPSKAGVKLGLAGSSEWDDPDRLLAGSGKRHRYVSLSSVSDVVRPGVHRLIQHGFDRKRQSR